MSQIVIYGENHQKPDEVSRIEKDIRAFAPDVLFHELLLEDVCPDVETIAARLANSGPGQLCDPRLNKDVYQLGYDLGIPLVGIDYEVSPLMIPSLAIRFRLREQNMVSVIEEWIATEKFKKIAVVVGDIHLRAKPSADFPTISFLHTRFYPKKGVKIIRSRYPEVI